MKSKKNLLPRGFVSKAEKLAEEFRKKLGVHSCGHLCAFELAKHLDVIVCRTIDFGYTFNSIQSLSGWSGMYLLNAYGEKIIIYNDTHHPARQQSTVMHELAHLICKHPMPTEIILPNLSFLRRYNEQHEQEAGRLGSTLQVSREGLVWAKSQGMTVAEMSEFYKASKEMIEYRLNISGVMRQFSRSIK